MLSVTEGAGEAVRVVVKVLECSLKPPLDTRVFSTSTLKDANGFHQHSVYFSHGQQE